VSFFIDFLGHLRNMDNVDVGIIEEAHEKVMMKI
jgi:hypothetical protein